MFRLEGACFGSHSHASNPSRRRRTRRIEWFGVQPLQGGISRVKAASGEKALKLAIDERLSLVVLDVKLPDIDGFEVCRRLRKVKGNIPIIFLTARAEEIDCVTGLEIGADDYMVKPFGFRELLARIGVQLRRSEAIESVLPRDSRSIIHLDVQQLRATRNGELLNLTAKEFEILKHLMLSRGEVVSRETLLKEVWGYRAGVASRTVDTHILYLRQKVEDDPSKPVHVVSVYGEGYRFVD